MSISWNDTCNSGCIWLSGYKHLWRDLVLETVRIHNSTYLEKQCLAFSSFTAEWIVERRTPTNTTSPIHFPLTSLFNTFYKPSLKLTANPPANRPGPKRKCHLNQPLIFRAFAISFREGTWRIIPGLVSS